MSSVYIYVTKAVRTDRQTGGFVFLIRDWGRAFTFYFCARNFHIYKANFVHKSPCRCHNYSFLSFVIVRCLVRWSVDGQGYQSRAGVFRGINKRVQFWSERICGLAGARNGRTGRTRPVNPSHSEDLMVETALSKKNSDGKTAHAGLATFLQIVS